MTPEQNVPLYQNCRGGRRLGAARIAKELRLRDTGTALNVSPSFERRVCIIAGMRRISTPTQGGLSGGSVGEAVAGRARATGLSTAGIRSAIPERSTNTFVLVAVRAQPLSVTRVHDVSAAGAAGRDRRCS